MIVNDSPGLSWGPALPAQRRRSRSLMDSRRHGHRRLDVRQERRLPLRTPLRVAQEELPPRGRLAPSLEDAPIDERPAVEVVVHVAREDEPVDERCMEEQL